MADFSVYLVCCCLFTSYVICDSWLVSPTVPDSFELSTERRARQRQEYERAASEKEALRAMMEEEQKREEEQKEKEEVARLRQEQVTGLGPPHGLFIIVAIWLYRNAFAIFVLSFDTDNVCIKCLSSILMLSFLNHLGSLDTTIQSCWDCRSSKSLTGSWFSAGPQGSADKALQAGVPEEERCSPYRSPVSKLFGAFPPVKTPCKCFLFYFSPVLDTLDQASMVNVNVTIFLWKQRCPVLKVLTIFSSFLFLNKNVQRNKRLFTCQC